MESLDSGGWSCLVAASRGCRLLATLVTDPDIAAGRASEEVTPGLWDLRIQSSVICSSWNRRNCTVFVHYGKFD